MKEYLQTDLFGASPQKSFHNTSKLQGEQLQEAEITAKEQEERVYLIFKKYRILSPSQCWEHYKRWYPKHKDILLTSIRRSITNLTVPPKKRTEEFKAKFVAKLIKTHIQINGLYGERSKEFLWKINDEQ